MAAAMRFTLGFVLAMAGCAAVSSANAATIAGTVTGPDGKGFRGAFVQAKNLKTKITVSVLSDNGGQVRHREPSGRRLPAAVARDRLYERSQERHHAHRRSERVLRSRLAAELCALERHLHAPGQEALARSARQGPPVHPLHGLPRLREPHGGGDPRRGRLARPRQLHARSHGLLHQPPELRLQRSEGRGHRLLHQRDVRRRLQAAEIAGRPAAISKRGPPVRRRRHEDRLCRIRLARAEPDAVERPSGQGRHVLDSLLRRRQQDRPSRSRDRRGEGISGSQSRHRGDPLGGAGAGRQRVVDRAGREQARALGPCDPRDHRIPRQRRQAHGADRSQDRIRVVDRRDDAVRSQDREIRPHSGSAVVLRHRARPGGQCLVHRASAQRQGRQGRRQDAAR